ncbi:Lens fiber membrane intrinsic protein [Liparis tanakae]|uniref:Lens fiber membrane intrinsic protein n=1 Tax=Liparis tanakae TaxID=230148 RepID=A0A4Z2H438_9TELE|nr:Lens fiber membrane intrinsic protein [Liparis tanakae]
MQYRHSSNYMHQGLWRYCVPGKCMIHTDSIGFFVMLAMAIYTGVTVNYYGKRYGSWRFSWSYIMGWVSVVLTFFSGIFYMCAYRMHECPRNTNSR